MIAKKLAVKTFEKKEFKKNIESLERILQNKYNLSRDEYKEFGKYQYSRLLHSEKIRITTHITKPNEYKLIEISFLISAYDEKTTDKIINFINEKYADLCKYSIK